MAQADEFVGFAVDATPGLFRRALMLTNDHHAAEDLVQETLARMYVQWSRINRDQSPVGYAYTTLYRLFVSTRRHRWSTELPSETLPENHATFGDVDLRLDLHARRALQAQAGAQVTTARASTAASWTSSSPRRLRRRSSWAVTGRRRIRRPRSSSAV